MKKIAFLLLSMVLLTACGAQPTDEQVSESTILLENELDAAGVTGVTFYDQAVQWSTDDIVTAHKDYYSARVPEYVSSDPNQSVEDYLSKTDEFIDFWAVGTVLNGTYKGQTVVLAKEVCDGPCPSYFYRYAVDESTDTWTMLTPYSEEVTESLKGGPATAEDTTIKIPDLDLPDTLPLYENDNTLLLDRFSDLDNAFFHNKEENFNNIYSAATFLDASFDRYYANDDTSCVYGVSPDGVMARYLVMPKVFDYEELSEEDAFITPLLTQNFDGRDYTLSAGRCGLMASCLQLVSATESEAAELTEVGSMDGRSVYMLGTIGSEPDANADATLLSSVYQAYNAYSMGLIYQDPPKTPMTIQEFVDAQNVVFFKLDSGKYTLAYDSDFAPSAECGKPVIYLYPETAQEVSVRVDGIEFTKTVPAYGNGWTVWASPTGVLKNLADGLEYPYLFWEGNASTSLPLSEGWTLAKKDIAGRLPLALQGMGLNEQESKDFMEFWLPKLLAEKTPYVKFYFVGTSVMNQIAPLKISPAPDTLLRVFMVYEGATKAAGSMPTFTAPVRHGFTAIEWGGSLY